MILFRSVATLALLCAAPAAFAQALTPAETAQVDTIVTDTLAKSGVPSASIAIVRGGKIVYARAYGKQSETGATRDDAPYQIASISKQFTAAADPAVAAGRQAEPRRSCFEIRPRHHPGRHGDYPPSVEPHRGAAGLLAAGLQLQGDGDPGHATADSGPLGQEAARFHAGHAVAIFQHWLCRRGHDRRKSRASAVAAIPRGTDFRATRHRRL